MVLAMQGLFPLKTHGQLNQLQSLLSGPALDPFLPLPMPSGIISAYSNSKWGSILVIGIGGSYQGLYDSFTGRISFTQYSMDNLDGLIGLVEDWDLSFLPIPL